MRQITEQTVAICMATYNGEKYIREQIQSIREQTYEDWILFIHDDGSKDNTLSVIEEFVDEESIFLVHKNLRGGSAKDNFIGLLGYVSKNYSFAYYMFCDQDDVWLPDKIQISMERMGLLEQKFGKQKPIMVHTDLKVVDENLHLLSESYVKYRSLDVTIKEPNRLVAQNNITGCTMLWNQELNQRICVDNPNVAQHDWWFAVVTSLIGIIEFVDTPTILYRQHGANSVGATHVNSLKFILMRLGGLSHVKKTVAMSVFQAKAIGEVFGDEIEASQRQMLLQYGSILEVHKLKRWRILFKYKCFKQGLIQRIGQFLFV